MIIFIDEETGKVIDNFDNKAGTLTERLVNVFYRYVVDKEAEYEEVVVAEYPETDGKDVEQRVVVEEEGHWEMLDEDKKVLDWPILINTDKFPKDEIISDTINVQYFHRYTPEELEEIRLQNEKIEQEQQERRERDELLDALPARMDSVETAQDDIILLLADMVGGAI